MAASKAPSETRANIQFSCRDPKLPKKIAEDVRRSSFTSRSKYLNALLDKVLSFKTGARVTSCIEELFELIDLFESLPIERIRRLASTQNRNFSQMVKHLLEIALSYYPEEAQLSVVVQDVHSPARVRERRSARSHHRAQPDMSFSVAAVKGRCRAEN